MTLRRTYDGGRYPSWELASFCGDGIGAPPTRGVEVYRIGKGGLSTFVGYYPDVYARSNACDREVLAVLCRIHLNGAPPCLWPAGGVS